MYFPLLPFGNPFPTLLLTKFFTTTQEKLATFTRKKMEMRSESTRSVYFCTTCHPNGKTKLTNKVENSASTLTRLPTHYKSFGSVLCSISSWKSSLKLIWLPESEFLTKALIEPEQQAHSDLKFGLSSPLATKTSELKSINIWKRELFLRLLTPQKRTTISHLLSANAILIKWSNSNSTKYEKDPTKSFHLIAFN